MWNAACLPARLSASQLRSRCCPVRSGMPMRDGATALTHIPCTSLGHHPPSHQQRWLATTVTALLNFTNWLCSSFFAFRKCQHTVLYSTLIAGQAENKETKFCISDKEKQAQGMPPACPSQPPPPFPFPFFSFHFRPFFSLSRSVSLAPAPARLLLRDGYSDHVTWPLFSTFAREPHFPSCLPHKLPAVDRLSWGK